MKTVNLTEEEHAELMKIRAKKPTKASSAPSTEVVRAAGNSEGAKKGWEHRAAASIVGDLKGEGFKHSGFNAKLGPAGSGTFSIETSRNYESESDHNSNVKHDWTHETGTHAKYFKEEHGATLAHQNVMSMGGNKYRHTFRVIGGEEKANASDGAESDIIHCRASSAAGAVLAADKAWNPGEPVDFMWMPAGIHTICAGFRNGSIELTVRCDENTASVVQSSLDQWRAERPKQEPFGCIEHREHEASVRVSAQQAFSFKQDGDPGVYISAEPTVLGAQNVNGKVHRSWSPSFTTDADYSQAKTVKTSSGTVLVFPEGVRGSRSNPAEITGVDFCVGTLTNKPAFHAMSPVKSSEGEFVAAANPRGINQYTVGQTVKFDGRSADGRAQGFFDVEIVNPHSNKDKVTHTDKHGRMYEGAVSHIPTATVKNKRSGNTFEAHHFTLRGSDAVTAAGNSEGAKKGWEHRISSHDISEGAALYKAKAWQATAEAHNLSKAAYKTNDDVELHHAAREAHERAALIHKKAGNSVQSEEHEMFQDEHVEQIKGASQNPSAHASSASASAHNSIHAHCRNTLLEEVPDATAAEIACYEKCIDEGGDHASAVLNIKAQRDPNYKAPAKASGESKLEAIYARHAQATATATDILARELGAPITVQGIYEKVTAGGTSEGAKKGWEKREHGSPDSGYHYFNHENGIGSVAPNHKAGEKPFKAVSNKSKGGFSISSHNTLEEAKAAVEKHLKASSSTSQDIIHCRAALLEEVPDATPEEIACYEKCIDGGGSHPTAVLEIKAKRDPSYVTQASEAVRATWSDAARKAAAEAKHKKAASIVGDLKGEGFKHSGFNAKLGPAGSGTLTIETSRNYESENDHMSGVKKDWESGTHGSYIKETHGAKLKHKSVLAMGSNKYRHTFEVEEPESTTKASEPASPDTIAARQSQALDAANKIAAEKGVARTALDEVYEKVTGSGTSEGAKKGWESRQQGGVSHHYFHGKKAFYAVHQVSKLDGQGGFEDRWTAGGIGHDGKPFSIYRYSAGGEKHGVFESAHQAKLHVMEHDNGIANNASDTTSAPGTVRATWSDAARKAAAEAKKQGWNHEGSYEGGKVHVFHKVFNDPRFGEVHRVKVDDGEPEAGSPKGYKTKSEAMSHANKYISEAGYKKDGELKASSQGLDLESIYARAGANR